ncbi:MAG: glycoside hydrolase family 65 protein [Clostridiales bacterium]|nr:glycoside hydrolase family 65 protein [Clostridiales bacterium]
MKELVITTNSYDEKDIPDLGNRFLTGNGYMGVRGTLEEYGKQQLAAVNLSGIFDRYGDGWREPLNAPNPFSLQLLVNGKEETLCPDNVKSHEQLLDARRGLHLRTTEYMDGTSMIVERFAHMEQVHLLCMNVVIKTKKDAHVRLNAAIDGDVWDIHGPHYRDMSCKENGDAAMVVGCTNEGDSVAVCAAYHTDAHCERQSMTENRKQITAFQFECKAGDMIAISMTASVFTSQDAQDPLLCAQKFVLESPSYPLLRKSHIQTWASLWDKANVEIEGDAEAERALNYSIYHLLCIAPRHASSLSIPARGLSGQTYKGAIFWDTEMFMLDFYLAVLPDVAKTLLRYRIDTLDGAREKARQYGYEGAFYAWESQEGGYDACSDYNVTDVFTGRPMRTYFRDKQVHITSAVVYGLYKYARWTGDESLWLEGGAEILIEAARFYYSYLVKSLKSDVYELWDVIGPDEYHERVNNNAYTNEMARFAFLQAVEISQWLKAEHSDEFDALNQKLNFEDELILFSQAAEQLKQPTQTDTGIIEQFDGYFKLEDTAVDAVRSRLKDPREYWGGAYGVASDSQIIKQADVITMLFMLRDQYDANIVRANYDYYLPRTEHGSSLSACMYALSACMIGRPNDAYPLFLKSAQADLVSGGKQWAGLVYIGGTHPAAAGGAYMTMLWGFLGFDYSRDAWSVAPKLPKGWKEISCKIMWHGKPMKLSSKTTKG